MLYRITFVLMDKTYEVLAKTVDFESHPFLVQVEDFEFEDQSSLIISPNGSESRKRFGEVDKLHIPVQSVKLLEEIPEPESKVSTLKIAGNDKST